MTLWILFCRMPNEVDTLFTFYARDGDDAERQARELLAECGYKWIDLKAYPGGFVIHHAHIPGVIEEDRA